VFDAVAEVALGASGVSPVSFVSCKDSSASAVMSFKVWFAFEGAKGDVGEAVTVVLDGMLAITLGSCLVFGAVDNVALITLGSCARCCCLVPVVCAGVVVFISVWDGAIAR